MGAPTLCGGETYYPQLVIETKYRGASIPKLERFSYGFFFGRADRSLGGTESVEVVRQVRGLIGGKAIRLSQNY